MEKKSLITELSQGKELAIQLRTHLDSSAAAYNNSHEISCYFLTEMIQSSFEKALLLLNWKNSMPHQTNQIVVVEEEEQKSTQNKRKKISTTKDVLKKRKLLMPRWTKEVKVCSGTAPEGPLNDGYNWRKYGQKDIHSAIFPRCYYRCTHRLVRGCLATKQVQRSDKDQNIFEVTYRGRHTCNQSHNLGLVSVSNNIDDHHNEIIIPEQTNQNSQIPNEFWFNFGESQPQFNVKTEDFDNVLPLFSSVMDPTLIVDDRDLSASAVSPAASATAWDWSGINNDREVQMVQSSEQSEIISATTSVTNSPICYEDWNLSLDNVHFDQTFPFECLDF